MPQCFFVSDLHGRATRYARLWQAVRTERPAALLMGGDLFPSGLAGDPAEFLERELKPALARLREELGDAAPRVLVILGNDDPRVLEGDLRDLQDQGLLEYVHGGRVELLGHPLFGYAYVPPTPFLLKDWERYDVSRYVDPGCVSPEEGRRSVEIPPGEARHATIAQDLARLAGDSDQSQAVWLFHAPPYDTALDRAALDGKAVEHAPLDLHVGSIAIRRFVAARQPLLTLHGHVHESARLTGAWRARLGRTHCFSAAHDGHELALVRFDLDELERASRDLLA
jgi:Icc-related predicted phosphoesterase